MEKLTRDLRQAAATLNENEARYLVDTYYQIQEFRKATTKQCRSMSDEPHETLLHFKDNFEGVENDIKKVLDVYTSNSSVGRWCKSIIGIGPVITAGLLAYIDITKAPTADHIQAYAGLDPTKEWRKGEKRPWNAEFKCLCRKIGQSFVKVCNNSKDVYGHIYKIRKEYEQAKNENGDYAEQARAKLAKYNIGKDTDAYKYYIQGKLPPAHIQQRCERYAVKIFLSHLHQVMYLDHYDTEPPKPYALAILIQFCECL
ncbi:MAG: IS110 family transposase [Clostridiales bacterium]|nr:IS110 family transposase [Clostridiales bacterium]